MTERETRLAYLDDMIARVDATIEDLERQIVVSRVILARLEREMARVDRGEA